MAGAELTTARLVLRRPRSDDAGAIAAALGSADVARWLSRPPWPYGLAEAQAFLNSADVAHSYAIALRDEGPEAPLCGLISLQPDGAFGYWLAPEAWGRGIMSEAASALVAAHFAGSDAPLTAGVHEGNHASAAILARLGFRDIGASQLYSPVLGQEVASRSLVLSREDWLAAGAPIRTPRLTLRDRRSSDYPAQLALVSDYAQVKWTASWPWPADPAFTMARCRQPIPPEMGRMCVIERQGRVIGMVSVILGELGYLLERDAWGQGYATEAAAGLVDAVFAGHPAPAEIRAGVFDGNDASVRVLERLGFRRSGRSEVFCRAQGKTLPGPEFVLTRAQREAARRPGGWPQTAPFTDVPQR